MDDGHNLVCPNGLLGPNMFLDCYRRTNEIKISDCYQVKLKCKINEWFLLYIKIHVLLKPKSSSTFTLRDLAFTNLRGCLVVQTLKVSAFKVREFEVDVAPTSAKWYESNHLILFCKTGISLTSFFWSQEDLLRILSVNWYT